MYLYNFDWFSFIFYLFIFIYPTNTKVSLVFKKSAILKRKNKYILPAVVLCVVSFHFVYKKNGEENVVSVYPLKGNKF